MRRKLKSALAVYLAGAVALGSYLILEAISKGGIERLAQKGAVEIVALALLYLMTCLLWPLVIISLVLQYLGVLPRL